MTRKAALLEVSPSLDSTAPRRRVGEVAGGAAAECAAVCCCCPCSMMNLLILAVYKVPRGLCRKAWAMTKKRRRGGSSKKGLLPRPAGLGDGGELKKTVSGGEEDDVEKKEESEEDAAFEKEMWDRFYGAGFWRSSTSTTTTHNKET